MKSSVYLCLFAFLVTNAGCKNPLDKKDKSAESPGHSEAMSVVDLSSLTTDQAIISTKFSKLSVDCTYYTKSFRTKFFFSKPVSQTLSGLVSWDILKEPVMKKKMEISNTNLNLEFKASLILELSLDGRYDPVLNINPSVTVKELRNNGDVRTTTSYNQNAEDIRESQTFLVVDTSTETGKVENESRVKVECTLNALAKAGY